MGFIIPLITGAIAGWLAGKLMSSHFSMLGNIAIGIVGGIVGNIVLSVFGISGEGFIGHYTSTFLNSVLTNVGGTALQTGQGAQYWSCTECPMGSAWTMYFYQGTSYSSVNTEPHYVRPVFAF